jgi:hypothetical protein
VSKQIPRETSGTISEALQTSANPYLPVNEALRFGATVKVLVKALSSPVTAMAAPEEDHDVSKTRVKCAKVVVVILESTSYRLCLLYSKSGFLGMQFGLRDMLGQL